VLISGIRIVRHNRPASCFISASACAFALTAGDGNRMRVEGIQPVHRDSNPVIAMRERTGYAGQAAAR
jgi:hypothetical protein